VWRVPLFTYPVLLVIADRIKSTKGLGLLGIHVQADDVIIVYLLFVQFFSLVLLLSGSDDVRTAIAVKRGPSVKIDIYICIIIR
jgi:hypothetical protein